MYIRKMTLRNIRGFEHLEFNLERESSQYAGWTVFTGGNGSGKSTLLKAMAICLTGISAGSLQFNLNGWIRNKKEISSMCMDIISDSDNNDSHSSLSKNYHSTTKVIYYPNSVGFSIADKNDEAIEINQHVLTDKNDKVIKVLHNSYYNSSLNENKFKPALRKEIDWFSCGYGPFRRISGASPDAVQRMNDPVTERFATLFHESASLSKADEWLQSLKFKTLEGKKDAKEQLELVLELLRQDLLPNQITVDRVDSDGLWLRDKNDVQLSWADMSDGYRSALAMLVDILRHLMAAYGIEGLTTRNTDGRLVIQRSGVVLIDEIDAHLHPEWQRKIGFWLKGYFPNIQFLVTTHSPIICQAADKNGLFVLPDPGSEERPRALTQEEYAEVIASRPDTILLSPAFGLQNTRSPQVVEARAEWARLKAKARAGASLTQAEGNRTQELQILVKLDEEL